MTVRQYAVLRALLHGFHESRLSGHEAYRAAWHFFRGYENSRVTLLAFMLEAAELERVAVGDLLTPGSQNDE